MPRERVDRPGESPRGDWAKKMKVKPVYKYRHSCAFAPISAVEACLENYPSFLHFFVLLQFL